MAETGVVIEQVRVKSIYSSSLFTSQFVEPKYLALLLGLVYGEALFSQFCSLVKQLNGQLSRYNL